MKDYTKIIIVILGMIVVIIILWFAIGKLLNNTEKITGGIDTLYYVNELNIKNENDDNVKCLSKHPVNVDNIIQTIGQISVWNGSGQDPSVIAASDNSIGVLLENKFVEDNVMLSKIRMEDLLLNICLIVMDLGYRLCINDLQFEHIVQHIQHNKCILLYNPLLYVNLRHVYENPDNINYTNALHDFAEYKKICNIDSNIRIKKLHITYIDTIFNLASNKRKKKDLYELLEYVTNITYSGYNNSFISLNNDGNTFIVDFLYYMDNDNHIIDCLTTINCVLFRGEITGKYKYILNYDTNDNTYTLKGTSCSEGDGMFLINDRLYNVEIDEADSKLGTTEINENIVFKGEVIEVKYKIELENIIPKYDPLSDNSHGHLVKSILNMFSAFYHFKDIIQNNNDIFIYYNSNPLLRLTISRIEIYR